VAFFSRARVLNCAAYAVTLTGLARIFQIDCACDHEQMRGMAKAFGFDLPRDDNGLLLSHAQLCENIARACADEQKAKRFRELAQRCRDVAARN